jgi:hypothetical protein
MPNARKKVLVRRFSGDILPGYLPLSGFVRGQPPGPGQGLTVDLLDLTGRIVQIALKDIKTISFVRDFNLADTINPERIARRTFLARPRNEGLWVRIAFRSSDSRADTRPERRADQAPDLLEGLADIGLSLIDSLIDDSGLSISPPDIRSNTQRIFVPRSAIADLQILAVITTPSRKPAPVKTEDQLRKELQESLFDAPTPPNSRPN